MQASTTHYSYYTPKYFWLMLFGVWLVLSISLGIFSNWFFGMLDPESPDSILEATTYSATYSFLFLFLFGALWIPLNRYFPLHKKRNVIVHVVAQATITLFGFLLGNVITGKIHSMAYEEGDYLNDEMTIGLTIVALMCLIGILFTTGLFYTLSYVNRTRMLEQSRTESELMALRAQINPHFLFNSLNSIAALVQTSPEQAEEVTQDLADLFRYTLRASEKSMVPLSEEIELITMYLNIEKARFKDRLNIEMNIESELKKQYIPALIIQPIVENAIKHGISQKEGEHKIVIDISESENSIDIQVLDTGPGFPHKNIDQILTKGTGLSNVFKRLNLQFRNEFDFAILDQGIQLRVPITPDVKQSDAYSYKLNPDIRESFSG